MITPNGVHFERSHSGIPDINPDTHRLLIHGLVKRPLIFTLESLERYPRESRVAFLECGGNGQLLYQKEPAPVGVQAIHGLVSCAEWTGVKLSVLLQEAGVDPKAKWILAEGADAAGMSRSIPLAKAMDDALIALYQNGERVRPSNGYPMRLLLPGYEGNMNVKWLRRIKLTEGPTMTKDETSKYTITLPDGKSLQFVLPQEGKSVITQPSPGLTMKGARPLRNLRSCLVGLWQDHQGRGLGRRRQELGGGGVAAAGAVEGVDALPHSVALERRAGGPAKPRDRRDRLRPADAREDDRRARQPDDLSLQRHHDLGRFRQRRGEACLRVALSSSPPQVSPWLRPLHSRLKVRTSDGLATPEEIAAWDISIGPDGVGLPPGSGTPKQGEAVYAAKCVACHGEKGAGKPNDQLVGGQGTLPGDKPPVKTVGSFWPYATTVFDYVRRAMPYNESKSLTNDEVYAVVAYILNLNGIIADNDTMDAQTLRKVKMPNRDGFVTFSRGK